MCPSLCSSGHVSGPSSHICLEAGEARLPDNGHQGGGKSYKQRHHGWRLSSTHMVATYPGREWLGVWTLMRWATARKWHCCQKMAAYLPLSGLRSPRLESAAPRSEGTRIEFGIWVLDMAAGNLWQSSWHRRLSSCVCSVFCVLCSVLCEHPWTPQGSGLNELTNLQMHIQVTHDQTDKHMLQTEELASIEI